jgi:hypothetical protein
MKNILKNLLLGCLFINASVYAQTKLNESLITSIKNTVLDGARKQDFLIFTRLTSESEIKSCELEFQKTISDTRGKKEEIYVVKGSLSSHYFKDRFRGIASLKVNPLRLNLDKIENLEGLENAWVVVKPKFATVIVGQNNLNSFKYTEFECETGGLCTAFADDDKFRLTKSLIDPKSIKTKSSVTKIK